MTQTGVLHWIFSKKDNWSDSSDFLEKRPLPMAKTHLLQVFSIAFNGANWSVSSLVPPKGHFLWHHVLHCSPGPFCNSALSACCKTIYTVNLMLQILSFQLDHHIAFTRAPLNVRGLVMIFTQYTFNKLSFHPGSSYCSHARTTYVMDQGFSVPFEIFPCRIWSPTPQPAFARHRPSLYVGPLVQWWQQSLHPCSLKTTSGSVLLQLFWTTALSCPTEYPPKYVLCAVQVWLDFTTAKWSQLVGETALGKAAPWWGCTTATEKGPLKKPAQRTDDSTWSAPPHPPTCFILVTESQCPRQNC